MTKYKKAVMLENIISTQEQIKRETTRDKKKKRINKRINRLNKRLNRLDK